MPRLVIITPEMHKIAEFTIKVKYRCPGNVIEYTPVEFEVFKDGEWYKAVPLCDVKTRLLTDLPRETFFQIKNGKITECNNVSREVIEDIVCKMIALDVVDKPLQKGVE
jgi:hypothetical protein